MTEFPSAVPELPVENVEQAIAYYVQNLGFTLDWSGEDEGGIAGISRGYCRLFLTGERFRERYQNTGPLVIWINLNSIAGVNELHEQWCLTHARILSPPESKPWHLHEFTTTDLDNNVIRVFYDFSKDL